MYIYTCTLYMHIYLHMCMHCCSCLTRCWQDVEHWYDNHLLILISCDQYMYCLVSHMSCLCMCCSNPNSLVFPHRLNEQLHPILVLLKETESLRLAPELLEPEPQFPCSVLWWVGFCLCFLFIAFVSELLSTWVIALLCKLLHSSFSNCTAVSTGGILLI